MDAAFARTLEFKALRYGAVRRLVLTLAALTTATTAAYAQASGPSPKAQTPAAPAARRHRPIVFEQNVGQFPADTLYAAHGPEASLSIGAHGDVTFNGQTIRLVHARKVTARGEQATAIRYLGPKPQEAPAFGKVVFPGVLRGIDWVWGSDENAIAFEFVVHPGASPKAIALQFDRASRLRIENGDLVVTAQGRRTVHRRPRAYQEIGGERRNVAAAWRISGRHAKFALGRYDRRVTLVIDPQFASRQATGH